VSTNSRRLAYEEEEDDDEEPTGIEGAGGAMMASRYSREDPD